MGPAVGVPNRLAVGREMRQIFLETLAEVSHRTGAERRRARDRRPEGSHDQILRRQDRGTLREIEIMRRRTEPGLDPRWPGSLRRDRHLVAAVPEETGLLQHDLGAATQLGPVQEIGHPHRIASRATS